MEHRLAGSATAAQSVGVKGMMILGLAAPLLVCGAFGGAPSADEVLGKARAKAGKENKNILVDFSASW